MSEWIPDTLPERGLAFTTKLVRVINRSGITLQRGNVAMFDIRRSAPETTNDNFGDRASCWVNVVRPNFEAAGGLGGQAYAPHVLIMEEIEDDREGMACMWGSDLLASVDALGCAVGDPMMIDVDLAVELQAGAANLNTASKVIAIAQQARVGAGLVRVLFNGWHNWAKV